jgi:hypothetical protein
VAPSPTSGEDASLQVGPESYWWLVCSCAPVDVVATGPPMVTPTAMPVFMVDQPVTLVFSTHCWAMREVPRVAVLVLKTYLFSFPQRP